jgi:protoheme IX farnesyltransferase
MTPRPGPWLRLTALAGAGTCALTVVSGALALGEAHRLLAALVVPPLAAIAVAGRTTHRRLFVPALVSLSLFAVAALLTGRELHLAAAAAAFAATAVLCALAFRGAPAARTPWRDYIVLTKPRIMSLLLVTGACGYVVGGRGIPSWGGFAAMLAGLALACGGASALNHVLDADIDPLMGRRTRRRPVAAGRVPPSRALEFGLALSALSFTLLASTVNVLTAVLALVGNLFYVLVYTRWLKRSTPQNIVIGGAAGAVPPIVGYAAATGNITLAAVLLFAIVFFWTPPHFWSLALLIKDDYAAASIPMLPVVRGERATTKQIVWYSLVLAAVSLAPVAVGAGRGYQATAVVLDGVFVALAVQLRLRTTPRRAAVLFHYSLLYLALLFAALATDAAL